LHASSTTGGLGEGRLGLYSTVREDLYVQTLRRLGGAVEGLLSFLIVVGDELPAYVIEELYDTVAGRRSLFVADTSGLTDRKPYCRNQPRSGIGQGFGVIPHALPLCRVRHFPT